MTKWNPSALMAGFVVKMRDQSESSAWGLNSQV